MNSFVTLLSTAVILIVPSAALANQNNITPITVGPTSYSGSLMNYGRPAAVAPVAVPRVSGPTVTHGGPARAFSVPSQAGPNVDTSGAWSRNLINSSGPRTLGPNLDTISNPLPGSGIGSSAGGPVGGFGSATGAAGGAGAAGAGAAGAAGAGAAGGAGGAGGGITAAGVGMAVQDIFNILLQGLQIMAMVQQTGILTDQQETLEDIKQTRADDLATTQGLLANLGGSGGYNPVMSLPVPTPRLSPTPTGSPVAEVLEPTTGVIFPAPGASPAPTVDPAVAARDRANGYGSRIGLAPGTMVTMDFRDFDGDGVDDRYQTGPGAPPAGFTNSNGHVDPNVVRERIFDQLLGVPGSGATDLGALSPLSKIGDFVTGKAENLYDIFSGTSQMVGTVQNFGDDPVGTSMAIMDELFGGDRAELLNSLSDEQLSGSGFNTAVGSLSYQMDKELMEVTGKAANMYESRKSRIDTIKQMLNGATDQSSVQLLQAQLQKEIASMQSDNLSLKEAGNAAEALRSVNESAARELRSMEIQSTRRMRR